MFSAALAFLSIHTQSIAALAYPYHSSIGFEEWLFAFVWGSLPFKIERASHFGVSNKKEARPSLFYRSGVNECFDVFIESKVSRILIQCTVNYQGSSLPFEVSLFC